MSLNRPKNFFGENIPLTVFISNEQLADKNLEEVYGKYYEDTGIFNIFPGEISNEAEYLGKIYNKTAETTEGFYGIRSGDTIDFFYDNEKINIEPYSLYLDIFSRNKGLLETDVMKNKCVVLLGCGSVGSLVACELARSGVGNFILVDADTLEYHNLCRHQCGIEDVGDLKVNAVERKIHNINPKANVIKFDGIFQNIPKEILDNNIKVDESIIVGCADNRAADVYANRIAIFYQIPFLSIGFWERAYAGEIFYYIPNENMPCYECALGKGSSMSNRVEANHHVYSNQENIEEIKFEPGISVDINFITSIGIKLILDILNRNNTTYTPKVLDNLKQYTLICNTNKPEVGGDMVEIFSYPLQVTTSLKVNFGPECQNGCKYDYKEEANNDNPV